ncbi:DUF1648 domain-containing protein [uncultured Rothia sp.]|uniref:DUF1648 domain-containing protein n=1 Tax=uncultured Rothia sp. TaxID=316088 RepID=UPI0032163129
MENSPQLPGRTERPVPASPAKSSRILEGISAFVLAAGVIYAVVTYVGLPQIVPVHLGPNGEPDDWGDKNQFLLAPIMLCMVTLFCLVIARFPRIHNVPKTPSTAEGWQALYTCSRNMLLWTSIGVGLMLVFCHLFNIASRKIRSVDGVVSAFHPCAQRLLHS